MNMKKMPIKRFIREVGKKKISAVYVVQFLIGN